MSNLFIDGSKLQYHLGRVESWLRGEDIFPIHVEISPSSACNQRCIICCVDYKGHKPALLSGDILLKLADDFANNGVKSCLLAGEGEPLINQHIAEFAGKCYSRGVDVALNSNAVLLTEELSEKLLPCLTWARFTLNSSNPRTYAEIHSTREGDFFKVIKNIKKAIEIKKKRKLNVTLGIQQILVYENVKDVYKTAKLAKKIGVDYFTVKRFSKHPQNVYDVPEDLYKQSIDQFKRCEELTDSNFQSLVRWNQFEVQCIRNYEKCIGLPFITQILANGGVYPCCQYFNKDSFCFGNLYEKSFSEIWLSERKHKIIKFMEENVNVNNCMTFCRHHSTNMFLWQFLNPPEHVNFI